MSSQRKLLFALTGGLGAVVTALFLAAIWLSDSGSTAEKLANTGCLVLIVGSLAVGTIAIDEVGK